MSIIYDDDTVQDVKDAADIVEIVGESVSLKKTGINFSNTDHLCFFNSTATILPFSIIL